MSHYGAPWRETMYQYICRLWGNILHGGHFRSLIPAIKICFILTPTSISVAVTGSSHGEFY